MKINNTKGNSAHHLLVQWLELHVRRIIRKLNVHLARCSMTWQIVVLLIITVIAAFANVGILWKAIHEHQVNSVHIQPVPFATMSVEKEDSILTNEEYNNFSRFIITLDSLRNNPQSRSIYNELIQQHPGIRDSIQYLLIHYPPR